MSRYKAYGKYKDSGAIWGEQIPSHWVATSLKRYCSVTDGSHHSPKIESDGYPFISVTDVGINTIDFDNCKYISEQDYEQLAREGCKPNAGNVLLTKDGTIGRAAIVLENYPSFVILSSLGLLAPSQKLLNKYLYYYLVSGVNIDQMNSCIHGSALRRMTISKLNELLIFIPQLDEQEKIANFLDHETAKIDLLIEKQQALIELLKEKRQAVISHAVTKGLNPNAPMKDSGVEWLGEVPANWTLPKIKWFFRTESGGTPNTAKHEDYYLDGEIPWIRTTDLNNSDLYETPVNITERAINESACSLLPVNSVLIAMYGGAGSIGKHALLKFESTINQAVCAILPNPKIHPEFLHLYVEFYRPYWMVGAEGTRKDPNINQDVIRELTVPCPTEAGQDDIVAMVKEKLAKIDLIIEKSESNIEFMQERRTALISAAVTGKIDVRDWQKPAQA